jgi:hypothetical protein
MGQAELVRRAQGGDREAFDLLVMGALDRPAATPPGRDMR